MSKFKIGKISKYILPIFLAFAGNTIFGLTVWLLLQYENIIFDQFLYQILTSSAGTDFKITLSGIVTIGGCAFVLTALDVLLFSILSGKFKTLQKSGKYFKFSSTHFCNFCGKTALPLSLAVLTVGCSFFTVKLDLADYAATNFSKSDFIEENYVEPNEVGIKFPEKKRNLVYIFLESMENTYVDGKFNDKPQTNYIPELYDLAKENVSFSNTNDIGGAYTFSGTTWTASAMVSQTSGLTVKVPYLNKGYNKKGYMAGAVTLGDILEKEGYNQVVLLGSDIRFANDDMYFEQHGNYEVLDTTSLKKEGRLDKNYHRGWGFEDQKLFEFAKQELTELSKSDKPFNLTMLTSDTHFPDGFQCEECENHYNSGYANSLACSSRQIYRFVTWIKEQPFYENTTIILCGDHLTMDPMFLEGIDDNYNRTIYNCIINSAVTPVDQKNREYGSFDMFPTTLAAMGAEIEGERLALGTNLFANEKTLTEKHGFEWLDKELQKNSEFYNEEILCP